MGSWADRVAVNVMHDQSNRRAAALAAVSSPAECSLSGSTPGGGSVLGRGHLPHT